MSAVAPAWRKSLFLLGYAALITHELDAVVRAEWRVLPGLSWLPETTARPLFILLHVPLLVVLTGLLMHGSPSVRDRTQYGIAVFLVVHAGLHLLFSGHRHYGFANPLSEWLIFGGAAIGFLWLALTPARPDDKGRPGFPNQP